MPVVEKSQKIYANPWFNEPFSSLHAKSCDIHAIKNHPINALRLFYDLSDMIVILVYVQCKCVV